MSSEPLKVCFTCKRAFHTEAEFFNNTSRWRLCEQGHLWFNCACNSTGMILKGKQSWYDPTRTLSGSGKSLFNRLAAQKSLPRLPTAVMELQQLLEDEEVNTASLAKATKTDPLMSSHILTIANHMATGGGQTIATIEHAISYIGPTMLSDIVLTAAIQCFKVETKWFNSDEFWQASFLTGRVAENLASRLAPAISSDIAYLGGALCNIGKIVLALLLPEDADAIYKEMRKRAFPTGWRQAEMLLGAPDHTVLGEIGGCFWGLPVNIIDCIQFHHSKENLEANAAIELRHLVRLANQISHWVNLEPHKLDEGVIHGARHQFNLTKLEFEKLADSVLEDMKASSNSNVG